MLGSHGHEAVRSFIASMPTKEPQFPRCHSHDKRLSISGCFVKEYYFNPRLISLFGFIKCPILRISLVLWLYLMGKTFENSLYYCMIMTKQCSILIIME